MSKRKLGRRLFAIILIFCMMVASLPAWPAAEVAAAGGDLEVRFGIHATRIGNYSYSADNAFNNFINNQSPGFIQTKSRDGINISYGDEAEGADVYLFDGDAVDFNIDVASNPALKALASSNEAEVIVGWSALHWVEECETEIIVCLDHDYQGTKVSIAIDGNVVLEETAYDGGVGPRNTGYREIGPTSKITIHTEGVRDTTDNPSGPRGLYVKFRDVTPPVMDDYTFLGNGVEDTNTAGDKLLFVTKQQYVSLAYNFSEPVRPTMEDMDDEAIEGFLRHFLFTNYMGDGLPAEGVNQFMINRSYSQTDFTANQGDIYRSFKFPVRSSIEYRYTASKYHYSANNPMEPKILGTSADTLEKKLRDSHLTDAAGNAVRIPGSFPNTASGFSNSFLRGKTVNPFDYDHGGYRVIVDAVPPKYTKVANGIQPLIVTGVTVNKNDSIDFDVQLTEAAIVKRGWDEHDTFLLFNNGMKATYVSGQGTDRWRFHLPITAETKIDVPLLKVIALTHKNKEIDTTTKEPSDTNVLQDYAGNMLVQPANYDSNVVGLHVDIDEFIPACATPSSSDCPKETSNLNSKVDWAKLAIDNTYPVISFNYEDDSVSAATYMKRRKITIDATDANVIVPSLDPDEPGKVRPSRGIYRPINMTGTTPDNSPGVGLVYYFWSQEAENPLAGKEGDNFAALKRYTLTGLQPRVDLYPDDPKLANFDLMVANNKTNLLSPPPDKAFTPEGSGVWYLHTWTADMTWESARELMQYDKMKAYKAGNSVKYQGWIDEYKLAHSDASDADAEIYADQQALAEVGKYKDTSVWNLDDFKHEDSNWTYNAGPLLLDNKKPEITFGTISGNKTAEATVAVTITEENSGIDTSKTLFQWVKPGGEPEDIEWLTMPRLASDPITGSIPFTVTTKNNVIEDGVYELHVKVTDKAGNEQSAKLNGTVEVDSTVDIKVKFKAPNDKYVQSHDIDFGIQGVTPDKVEYAYSSSSTRPGEDKYKELVTSSSSLMLRSVTSLVYGSVTGSVYGSAARTFATVSSDVYAEYIIPSDNTLNGDTYLHIKVKEKDLDRYYYYFQVYKFDNAPPDVTFSQTGVAYPKESHNVGVTSTDLHNQTGTVTKYQWLKATDAPPNESSANWVDLPSDGRAIVGNTALNPGESVDYVLYVKAEDGAGNKVIKNTGAFKLAKEAPGVPISVSKSDLIYVYGDATDGYYAIVKLGLNNASMEGYEYSISPDGGTTWNKWLPYSNFVKVSVPSTNVSQFNLKVKFRSAGGQSSEVMPLSTANYSTTRPLYAVAVHSTTRPVGTINGVTLTITAPAGVKVVPAPETVNPAVPQRLTGNDFKIVKNGVYTFELTDLTDTTKKDELLVVVSNVDAAAPVGSIEYSITERTTSNVVVKLGASEPVRVTNNDGTSKVFTENGEFEFKFEDEAGNEGSIKAVITNIDRDAPTARIVASYTYGNNGSKTFNTIKDGSGNVVLAQGVTLEVQKESPGDDDFILVQGTNPMTLTSDGTAEFTISDHGGNTTVLSKTVSNIVSSMPEPDNVIYEFVDDNGSPLSDSAIQRIDSKEYAKGKVKVTVTGKVDGRNKAFIGKEPDTAAYTNQISDEQGGYAYTMTYSANGEKRIAFSDLLGNVRQVPIKVEGLDNVAPTIQLNSDYVAIMQNQANFNALVDLGGYVVSDNLSKAEHMSVTISGLDLSKLGMQRVTYTATDEVGNTATATQNVAVLSADGLLILGNDQQMTSAMSESILFDRNDITFNISRYNEMEVDGQSRTNELGQYDILYHSGLYREGQMKYIAESVSLEQLLNDRFEVVFPETGWYTIIVRTQEREREYATFFVGKMTKQASK